MNGSEGKIDEKALMDARRISLVDFYLPQLRDPKLVPEAFLNYFGMAEKIAGQYHGDPVFQECRKEIDGYRGKAEAIRRALEASASQKPPGSIPDLDPNF